MILPASRHRASSIILEETEMQEVGMFTTNNEKQLQMGTHRTEAAQRMNGPVTERSKKPADFSHSAIKLQLREQDTTEINATSNVVPTQQSNTIMQNERDREIRFSAGFLKAKPPFTTGPDNIGY